MVVIAVCAAVGCAVAAGLFLVSNSSFGAEALATLTVSVAAMLVVTLPVSVGYKLNLVHRDVDQERELVVELKSVRVKIEQLEIEIERNREVSERMLGENDQLLAKLEELGDRAKNERGASLRRVLLRSASGEALAPRRRISRHPRPVS
ncbi:MAG: hypothetical protein ACLPN5_06285 [Roseiarcus sp.]